MSYMEIRNLKKVYNPYGIHPKVALNGLDFEVEKGDFICIMGASGSGKTTLVNILSTIDEATHGQIFLNQKDLLLLYQKKSKNRIIRINTGILSNMKQKIKEFYH